jgi:hypothetical protein
MRTVYELVHYSKTPNARPPSCKQRVPPTGQAERCKLPRWYLAWPLPGRYPVPVSAGELDMPTKGIFTSYKNTYEYTEIDQNHFLPQPSLFTVHNHHL